MTHALIQESIDKRQHVRDLLAQTPDDYVAVRELWKSHSLAEDARDIAGLMATLTDDCVYELVQTGHRWEGKEGATRFYIELLIGVPRYRFRPDQHRGRAAGCLRGGGGERHLLHTMARHGADRREDGVAQRDLLPLGPRCPTLHRRAGLLLLPRSPHGRPARRGCRRAGFVRGRCRARGGPRGRDRRPRGWR